MNLEKHIEILLLDNDCVIIPGLGGFIAYHTDARYDSENSVFMPPTRVAGFNPKLSMNDNLIAQSYVESYDISYPEAVKRISSEAEKLKMELESSGSHEIPGVGTLKTNKNGCYDFEPYEAGLLTPDLYGLGCFEAADIKSVEAKTPVSEVRESFEENKEEKNNSKFIRIKVSTIRNVAAAAIAIFAFLLLSSPLGNGDKNIASIASLQNSVFHKMMPIESDNVKANEAEKISSVKESETETELNKSESEEPLNTDADNLLGNKIEETAKKPETSASATEKSLQTSIDITKPDKYYCIVLASALSKYNARKYVEQLTSEGYKDINSIDCSNGMKVVYGNFASNKEASKSLETLRNNANFKDAWIYKVTVKK